MVRKIQRPAAGDLEGPGVNCLSPAGQSIKHNAQKLAPVSGPASLHLSRWPARQTVLICVMSGAPGPAGCARRTAIHQGRCAAGTWCTQQQCMALRARQSQGPRGGRSWSEPRPPVSLLRAGCGRGAAFAACSQPASRPPPWGSPMCRYCVTENRPLTKKRKACFACGASRHVVLHRIAERRTPVAVKAIFQRALRDLDGSSAGIRLGGRVGVASTTT